MMVMRGIAIMMMMMGVEVVMRFSDDLTGDLADGCCSNDIGRSVVAHALGQFFIDAYLIVFEDEWTVLDLVFDSNVVHAASQWIDIGLFFFYVDIVFLLILFVLDLRLGALRSFRSGRVPVALKTIFFDSLLLLLLVQALLLSGARYLLVITRGLLSTRIYRRSRGYQQTSSSRYFFAVDNRFLFSWQCSVVLLAYAQTRPHAIVMTYFSGFSTRNLVVKFGQINPLIVHTLFVTANPAAAAAAAHHIAIVIVETAHHHCHQCFVICTIRETIRTRTRQTTRILMAVDVLRVQRLVKVKLFPYVVRQHRVQRLLQQTHVRTVPNWHRHLFDLYSQPSTCRNNKPFILLTIYQISIVFLYIFEPTVFFSSSKHFKKRNKFFAQFFTLVFV